MKIFLAEKAPDALSIFVRCFEAKKEGSAYSLEGAGVHAKKIARAEIGKANMGIAFAFSEKEAVDLVRKWFSGSANYHEEEARRCRAIAESHIRKDY